MAFFIDLPTFADDRGNLTVIENILPFHVKRIFYIYGMTRKRGGHRHKKTTQAIISLMGSCEIYINNGKKKENIILNNPNKCLIIEREDWHTMNKFKGKCILLVLASEKYNKNDYIDEEYSL